MSSFWISTLADAAVRATALLGIAATVAALAGSRAAVLRHFVWALALVGVLILPLAGAVLPGVPVPGADAVDRRRRSTGGSRGYEAGRCGTGRRARKRTLRSSRRPGGRRRNPRPWPRAGAARRCAPGKWRDRRGQRREPPIRPPPGAPCCSRSGESAPSRSPAWPVGQYLEHSPAWSAGGARSRRTTGSTRCVTCAHVSIFDAPCGCCRATTWRCR